MTLPDLIARVEAAPPEMERERLRALAKRAEQRRQSDGLSYRQMQGETGVAFSTLARVLSGKGAFNRESERKVRLWLGEPVAHTTPADVTRQAEELGRAAARAFSAEIAAIVQEVLAARLKQEMQDG